MADYVLSASLELKDKFTSKINAVKRSAFQFQRSFKYVAYSVIRHSGGIEKSLRKITNSFTKLNSVAFKLGAGLITSTATAGATLGAFAIKGAADIEKYKGVLNTVLKDEKKASEAMVFANKFANKTPYQNQEVIEGVVRLESFGIGKENIEYIGDLAAATGKPLMQAVEAIIDAKAGELERLKEFGITKEKIKEYSQKVGKGSLINAKGQITDMKAFMLVMEDMVKKNYGGAMAEQAKTFYGSISTTMGVAKSAITQIAGIGMDGKVIAGSMFDYIRNKAVGLSEKLNKMQEDGSLNRWTKEVGNKFRELIPAIESSWKSFKDNWSEKDTKVVLDGISSSINLIADGFSIIGKVAPTAFEAITKHGKTALGVFAGLNMAQLAIRVALGDYTAIPGLVLGTLFGAKIAADTAFDTVKKTGVSITDMSMGNDNLGLTGDALVQSNKNREIYDRTKLENSIFSDNIKTVSPQITIAPTYNISGSELSKEELKKLSEQHMEEMLRQTKLQLLGTL